MTWEYKCFLDFINHIIEKQGFLFTCTAISLFTGIFLVLNFFGIFNVFLLLGKNENIAKFIFILVFVISIICLFLITFNNFLSLSAKLHQQFRQKINKPKQDKLNWLKIIQNHPEYCYTRQLLDYLVSNNLYKFSKEDIEQYRKETLPGLKEDDFFNSMNFRIEKAIDLETFGYKNLEKLLEDHLIIQSKNGSYSFDKAIWKMLKPKQIRE